MILKDGGFIEFKFEDNKLIQVDGRDELHKDEYTKNYGVVFNKVEE